ncbi:pheST operon leader peptide PheM [Pectobacterium brasiliense]|nr:pheST operon leader peptide PheM [Pectobacterium brasiliense]MBN3132982.1 pheST operon leader peptide PheM [Pectobacterium brasiliense]
MNAAIFRFFFDFSA